MNIDEVARHGAEFGQLAGERLHSILGRLPSPQEYMAFYGASAGTISGNALSEIVRNAGKEIGAQWLGEVLGTIQIVARQAGADIVLGGGISIKSMPTLRPAAGPPAAPPASEAAPQNACECETVSGKCWTCERELERRIDRFALLLKNLVVDTASAVDSPVCPICKEAVLDGLLAACIKKHAPSFGNRLGAAVEIFLAVVMPQVKAASPGIQWTKTMEAVSEQASAAQRHT